MLVLFGLLALLLGLIPPEGLPLGGLISVLLPFPRFPATTPALALLCASGMDSKILKPFATPVPAAAPATLPICAYSQWRLLLLLLSSPLTVLGSDTRPTL